MDITPNRYMSTPRQDHCARAPAAYVLALREGLVDVDDVVGDERAHRVEVAVVLRFQKRADHRLRSRPRSRVAGTGRILSIQVDSDVRAREPNPPFGIQLAHGNLAHGNGRMFSACARGYPFGDSGDVPGINHKGVFLSK
eukprot:gene5741-biopygen6239